MTTRELAHNFVQGLPQEILEHHIDEEARFEDRSTFDDEAVEYIATELQDLIAHVIASVINAGSERDAIMEDEKLHLALCNILREW